ncbi:GNAT family N-acetyltransferase [Qipengyuania sediminis]|uniref:GNAT family N-acetyltransferase n=1 Tax=Qipengyuania sediminis TaxID=1532023 RepID=UPI001059DF0A|nr:GNAT family N-acetyltransferase [Qipengyuania sediminis]
MPFEIRPAVAADLPAIADVVERAYRGDTARLGWTHEADLLSDTRLDAGELEGIVADPGQALLTLFEGATPLGCVNVADRGDGLAYLGLLCIEPTRQGLGLGKRLIAAAEGHARDKFGCRAIEMTVIEQRSELIAYYERRGWCRTGALRPFPVPLDPPYWMEVLAKRLA